MKVEAFLERIPSDFFTGVPDSQLKALCDALMERYGISERHIIAANEGNAVALATGHFLASGQVPTVYLQNSGEGNAMNPLASLCAKGVYAIPLLLVIGYRGEPGVKDEPQHLFQGQPTVSAFVQYGKLAEAVGYRKYRKVKERESLEKALQEMAEEEGPILIEVCCALHSREDLGRPKSSPLENKKAFMQSLKD